VEIESAKGDTLARRPKLQKALAAVKRIKDDDYRYTPVIVAKLERLSRDPPPAGLRCLIEPTSFLDSPAT
jgi:hypothetical protein